MPPDFRSGQQLGAVRSYATGDGARPLVAADHEVAGVDAGAEDLEAAGENEVEEDLEDVGLEGDVEE